QDVFVPDENLLGEENKGFYLIMANFQWERLGMALGAVAKQHYLLERALAYVNERSAFGRPIGKFQVTRHKVAEIAVRAAAARAPLACRRRERVRRVAHRVWIKSGRLEDVVEGDAAARFRGRGRYGPRIRMSSKGYAVPWAAGERSRRCRGAARSVPPPRALH